MKKLVVCFGSPLRNDDGAALHVAQRLSEVKLDKDVKIITLHQVTPELAADISQYDLLIFLDSSNLVQETTSSEMDCDGSNEESGSLSHSQSLKNILTLSKKLYGRLPRTILVQIPGSNYGIGTDLSDHTRSQVDKAVRDVLKYL